MNKMWICFISTTFITLSVSLLYQIYLDNFQVSPQNDNEQSDEMKTLTMKMEEIERVLENFATSVNNHRQKVSNFNT